MRGSAPFSAFEPLSRSRTALAFVLVAAGSGVLALPRVLAGWPLWRDAIEYAATAWNLANGQGLVNPLMYTSYLAALHPPVPALAMRPIVVSVLLAGPLALGAGLVELRVAHVVWASALAASGVWVARRAMTGPAAVAFAIAVGWSYVWVLASQQLMSEATASGAVLLALALYRGFHASHARAAALAVVVFLGWLARPNLAVLAVAVPLAAILELGWRRALRAGPCWTFLLACSGLAGATMLVHWLALGVVPYVHYGVMFETVDAAAFRSYQWDPRGWRAFVSESAPEIAAAVANNASMLAHELFLGSAYLYLGWFATPALAYALLRHRGQPERIFAACAGLLVLASTLVVAVGFAPLRYPLPSAVCFWFLACAALGDLGLALRKRLRAAERRGLRRLGGLAAALPLALVVPLSVVGNWEGWLRTAPSHWRAYRRTLEQPKRAPAELRALCRRLDRNAVVASPDPWIFYLACGTAGVKLPGDLQEPAWAERYLSEVPLGYVVLDDRSDFRALHASPRLRRIAHRGVHTLYGVIDPLPGSHPWTAPPPLAEVGLVRPAPRRGPSGRSPGEHLVLPADRKPRDEALERPE